MGWDRCCAYYLMAFLSLATVSSKMAWTTCLPTAQMFAPRFRTVAEVRADPTYSKKLSAAFERYKKLYPEEPAEPGPEASAAENKEHFVKLDQRSKAFERELEKEFNGQVPFKIFDTPALLWEVTVNGKKEMLPAHLLRSFNIDHHGPLLRFHPADPGRNTKRNTTKQVLEDINSIVAQSANPETAIKTLNERYREVSTDNLGDGALAVWAAHNVDRLARDPVLRKFLAGATFYEDFGIFGTRWADLEKKAPNTTTRQKMMEQREFVEAIFNQYDRLLQDAYQRHPDIPGVGTSDRFNMLPREEQVQLMSQAVATIDRVLADPKYRKAQAQEFQKNVERMKTLTIANHKKLQSDLVQHLVDTEGISNEAAQKQVDAFSKDMFAHYSLGPTDAGYGRFSSWAAGIPEDRNVHSLLVISPLGEDKTGFISTHPHGRPITQRFKGAADELKRYAPGPFDIGGRPGPSDFYFSFSGINASPKEVVAAFYREWKKQAK